MIIPPASLSPEILNNILEEFITREGTDYGNIELSLSDKVKRLTPQILNGNVLIIFDKKSESIQLMPKTE
ncbi:MAG: YheU family protein [Marinagarivorans sp.]|nr:YheU family protein [Marinagarivorans sp.]